MLVIGKRAVRVTDERPCWSAGVGSVELCQNGRQLPAEQFRAEARGFLEVEYGGALFKECRELPPGKGQRNMPTRNGWLASWARTTSLAGQAEVTSNKGRKVILSASVRHLGPAQTEGLLCAANLPARLSAREKRPRKEDGLGISPSWRAVFSGNAPKAWFLGSEGPEGKWTLCAGAQG